MNQAYELPRHLRLMASLYPKSFREQYGEGFLSLLAAERSSLRMLIDLFAGAFDAHMQARKGSHGFRHRFQRFLGRSVMSGLYNLLALPLGIAYFVFLAVGLSSGFGLLITLAGLPILVLTVLGVYAGAHFERWLTSTLLDADLSIGTGLPLFDEKPIRLQNGHLSLSLPEVRHFFLGANTLKSLLYLLLKFPYGIASFTVLVTSAGTALLLFSIPLQYMHGDYQINAFGRNGYPEAVFGAVGGVVLLLVTLVASNGLAWLWSEVAKQLLGGSDAQAELQDVRPAGA